MPRLRWDAETTKPPSSAKGSDSILERQENVDPPDYLAAVAGREDSVFARADDGLQPALRLLGSRRIA